ncbi:MAG: SDR family NAD(P)-dependent oxidoreductase, partial [Nitrospirota bacterium]|nr:SDR family NAD(P)-dependent oxidoreductase [Nitrospirota bacterium]
MTLTEKIAVVTGGAQGIGQAIATTLAKEGADVVVADLDAERCQETVDLVQQLGRKALAVSVNVGDWEQVKGMMD